MRIPNTKRYRIQNPKGDGHATIVAVLPKNADVQAYLKDAAARFDWKAWEEQRTPKVKLRVGQARQRKK